MRARLLVAVGVLLFQMPIPLALSAAEESLNFERDIAPLLVSHCLECHQPNKRSGKLALNTLDELLAGGEQGPAIATEKPAASLLLQRISDGEMPPADAKGHRPL